MERQRFDNIWDVLEDSPAAAANMAMRSNLLIAIEQRVRNWGATQEESARRLGLTQPRLNDLLRGKIDKFSLDALVNIATQAGLAVRVEIAEAMANGELHMGKLAQAKPAEIEKKAKDILTTVIQRLASSTASAQKLDSIEFDTRQASTRRLCQSITAAR